MYQLFFKIIRLFTNSTHSSHGTLYCIRKATSIDFSHNCLSLVVSLSSFLYIPRESLVVCLRLAFAFKVLSVYFALPYNLLYYLSNFTMHSLSNIFYFNWMIVCFTTTQNHYILGCWYSAVGQQKQERNMFQRQWGKGCEGNRRYFHDLISSSLYFEFSLHFI